MLTAMAMEPDSLVCCKLILLAHSFYTVNNAKREYFSSFICKHGIWNSRELWVEMIELAAESKNEA